MSKVYQMGLAATCSLLLAAGNSNAQQRHREAAELVITNARVWTGSGAQPEAEAVAVRKGEIVHVGKNADVLSMAGPRAKVIDAKGRRIVPGLIDSHTHMVSGGLHMLKVNLRDAEDRAEFARRVAVRARELGPGNWVLGGRWTVDSWADPTPPSKEWIDAVTPHNPAFLPRMDGHMGLANSVALKAAGITRDGPPDPEGGRIDRDPKTGKPTGLLRDAAMGLVTRHIPAPNDEAHDEAMRRAVGHANRWGITMVHDMSTPSEWKTIVQFLGVRPPALRVYCFQNAADWTPIIENYKRIRRKSDDRFRFGGFKGFMDGSMGARTAYMAGPFSDNAPTQANWRGLLNEMADPPSKMTERCLLADKYGWQTAVHAIGDEAIHLLLDSYEQVQKTNGTRDRRQRVEHAQHINPEDIPRFAELGVIASMQPLHKADDGRYAEQVIGSHRLKGSYAYRSLLESGATVCFGSDWPVVSLNPFLGMAAAVTGRTNHGNVWLGSENISIEDALRCYTIHAARACFMEERVGTIEKGKAADLVMLDRDLLTIPAEEIAKVKPLMTIVGGKIVFAEAGVESAEPPVMRR